jgi:hypothetical protein
MKCFQALYNSVAVICPKQIRPQTIQKSGLQNSGSNIDRAQFKIQTSAPTCVRNKLNITAINCGNIRLCWKYCTTLRLALRNMILDDSSAYVSELGTKKLGRTQFANPGWQLNKVNLPLQIGAHRKWLLTYRKYAIQRPLWPAWHYIAFR